MLTDILTTLPRARLRRNILRKARATESVLATLRHEKACAIQHGAHTFAQFADIGIYLVITSMDLTALLSRQLLEHDPVLKNVYSRHLILVIYELADDFPDLFGKRLRAALQQLPGGQKHLVDWKDLAETMRSIRRDHAAGFRTIRNVAVAHRDMDGTRQLEAIESIDHKAIQSVASQIDTWISKATGLLTRLTKDYSWSRLQIREIAEKIEQTNPAYRR